MTSKSILSLPDFDAEDRAEAAKAQVKEESFTRAELDAAVAAAVEAARNESRDAGYKAGEADAHESIEARRASTIDALMPRIEKLLTEQEGYCAALEREMTGFMRDFCEKLFPEMTLTLGRDRLATELAHISRRALGSPWLEVRIPVGFADLARELAKPEGVAIEMRVIEDPDLGTSSASASWQNGRSDYDFEKLCRDVLSLFTTTET